MSNTTTSKKAHVTFKKGDETYTRTYHDTGPMMEKSIKIRKDDGWEVESIERETNEVRYTNVAY